MFDHILSDDTLVLFLFRFHEVSCSHMSHYCISLQKSFQTLVSKAHVSLHCSKKSTTNFPFRQSGGVKVPLSGLRQFLTTEIQLKMTKNPFYFMLKALFVLEIVIFLS